MNLIYIHVDVIVLFIRWKKNLNRSCVADEYLYLNCRFYRSLNMLVHQLTYLVCASYKICKIIKVSDLGKQTFVIICLVTWGRGVIIIKITKEGEEEGGLKFGIFAVMSFLNDPFYALLGFPLQPLVSNTHIWVQRYLLILVFELASFEVLIYCQ